ncbi:MAG: hypothetical protein EOP04_26665, partial [Proteobacteria bacterium]
MKKYWVSVGVIGGLVGASILMGCAPEKKAQKSMGQLEAVTREKPPIALVVRKLDGEEIEFEFEREKGFFLPTELSISEGEKLEIYSKEFTQNLIWTNGSELLKKESHESIDPWKIFQATPTGWSATVAKETEGSGKSTAYAIEVKWKIPPTLPNFSLNLQLQGQIINSQPFNWADDLEAKQISASWFTISHESRFEQKISMRLIQPEDFRVVTNIAEIPTVFDLAGHNYYSIGKLRISALKLIRVKRGRNAEVQVLPFSESQGWVTFSVAKNEEVKAELELGLADGTSSWNPNLSETEFSRRKACMERFSTPNVECFHMALSQRVEGRVRSQVVLADSVDTALIALSPSGSRTAPVSVLIDESKDSISIWKLKTGLE